MGNQVESKAEIVLSSLPCLTSSPLCWDILCDPISLSPFMNFFVYILHCFPHVKFSCDFSPPPQTAVLFCCLYVSFRTGPSPRLLPRFISYFILHSHQTIFQPYSTQKRCGSFWQTNLRSSTFCSGHFLEDFRVIKEVCYTFGLEPAWLCWAILTLFW